MNADIVYIGLDADECSFFPRKYKFSREETIDVFFSFFSHFKISSGWHFGSNKHYNCLLRKINTRDENY